MPLTSSREKKCYTIRVFHRSQQNIFSYKGVVATSILEFDLVKKYSNNVKSLMIYVIIIKHAKFSDSSNEPQLLPCAPACGYKIHALAVYLHLTFTTTFQLEVHLKSN